MKKLCLLAVLLVGCAPKQQPPICVDEICVPPVEKKEEPDVTRPVAPANPSTAYLTGYQDGYYGTWLAPIRWTVGEDYRNGWSAGNWDHKHNLPNKYPK